MVFSDTNGVSRSIKFDLGREGDVYWIFPESGDKISFHKSGVVHIKNNFDKNYYERLDLSQEAFLQSFNKNSQSFQKFFDVIEGKSFQPEGRTVYAWAIPNFQGKEQQLLSQFMNLKGRHATISLNPTSLANALTDVSPVLYETTDTKITKLTELQNSMVFDEDGHFYSVSNQKVIDFTGLSSLSNTSIMDLFGPLGRVFELMDDNFEEYYESEDDEEDDEFVSFFDNLKLKKI